MDKPLTLSNPKLQAGSDTQDKYAFQLHYLLSLIPDLFDDKNFNCLCYDNYDDITLIWKSDGHLKRQYIQVKDLSSDLSNSEFIKIFEHWKNLDSGDDSAENSFKLICRQLSQDLRPLRTCIESLRDYDSRAAKQELYDNTVKELKERCVKIGLEANDSNISILKRTYFDTDVQGIEKKESFLPLFVGKMQMKPSSALLWGQNIEPGFNKL